MRAIHWVTPVLLLLGCAAGGSAPRAGGLDGAMGALPVQRVRLYETGVAYFERAGKLRPGADTISLPASHVDDALKSLIVLSDGGRVRVSGVEFASVLSQALARVQAGLPTGKQGGLTYPMLLASLRGVEVLVKRKDGAELRGRLVDVSEIEAGRSAVRASPKDEGEESSDENGEAASEPATKADAAPVTKEGRASRHAGLTHYSVTLLATDGGVVRFASSEVQSLRPADPRLAARLDSAVSTNSQRGAQSARELKVSAVGSAPVRIGYVTETPVFRVTYRLMFGAGDTTAHLQGWVLVHNDTDEPWRDVALEIVNGRPDSFLVPLTAPRYLRRELAAPSEEMSTLPQLATRTADQIWGDHDDSLDDVGDAYAAGGLGLSGIGEGGGGQGYGAGHGSVGGSYRTTRSASSDLLVGNLAELAGSYASLNSAQFLYRMREAVTLGAHASTLVPFTEVALGVEQMTRFQWGQPEGRVAVRVTNASGQTLPEGPLAIYDHSGLAGEGALPRLVSGKDTWVSYGADLDLELTTQPPLVDTSRTQLVRFENGQLVEHYLRHREFPLQLTNKSALARRACIEVSLVDNAKLGGADRVLYDGGSRRPLAVFDLKPQSQLERTLVFDEGLRKARAVASLGAAELGDILRETEVAPPSREILKEAFDFVTKRADSSRTREKTRQALTRLEADIKRLEGTLEKLGNAGGEGLAPLTKRLITLEDQRHRLEMDEQALVDAEQQRLPALTAILERLNGVAPQPKR